MVRLDRMFEEEMQRSGATARETAIAKADGVSVGYINQLAFSTAARLMSMGRVTSLLHANVSWSRGGLF